MDNINLIRKLAWKFYDKTDIDFDELFSEASLAYCEALRSYDASKNTKLSTYAYACMHNHLINVSVKHTRYKERHDLIENHINSHNSSVENLELRISNFLMKSGHITEPKDSFEDLLTECSDDCFQVIDMILTNPDLFLGESMSMKRTKGTPNRRVKNALRQDSWSYPRINRAYTEIRETFC